jgi:hypothetical protein
MLCLILGDSIAVGLYEQSSCSAIARVGITSSAFSRLAVNIPESSLTIISLGSNDGNNTSYSILDILRRRIGGRVVWVLPAINDRSREVIISIAVYYGDSWIDLRNYSLYSDGVHPRSYKTIAESLGVSK